MGISVTSTRTVLACYKNSIPRLAIPARLFFCRKGSEMEIEETMLYKPDAIIALTAFSACGASFDLIGGLAAVMGSFCGF